jgi:three-Cys-motif partner protein
MKNTEIEHFYEEKPHTKIKHQLLEAVLEISLSISNSMNHSRNENKPYVYIDLYAGSGKFKDENNGSPLIALNAFKEYKNKRSFENIEMVVAERNEQNAITLKQNIEDEKKELDLNDISCSTYLGSWETYSIELQEYIKSNKWGFIFVDPFSLELNLGNLIDLIKSGLYYKDILILINKTAQERVLGKPDSPDIKKICKYFNVSEEFLQRAIKSITQKGGSNEDIIQLLTKRAFKELNKDYKINVAITRTRQGEIENADRFYLSLITSSFGVANKFLEKYSELLEQKKEIQNNGQLGFSLFELTYNSLEQKVKEEINNNVISLHLLTKQLFNVFLSWKYTEHNEIPHKTALLRVLNNLLKNNEIVFVNPEKAKSKCINIAKNKILAKAFNSKENLKTINIKLNR